MITTDFQLTGLTCSACAKLAKRKIEKIEGVKDIIVEDSGKVTIESDRDITKDKMAISLSGTEYKVL